MLEEYSLPCFWSMWELTIWKKKIWTEFQFLNSRGGKPKIKIKIKKGRTCSSTKI